MQYSIIQKSQLEDALRLDAEYYQPEYLELIKKLNSLETTPIERVAKPNKRKFKPREDEFFDYIEIAGVNLETGEYNIQKIIGKEAPDRAQWIVKKNDVLVSTVRPIRNAVVLIKEERENLVCSSGFAVLKPEKVSPQYLFIYLKTKPIIRLLDRCTTATMYPVITLEDILNTKIYLGDENFRQEIKNKVIEAQEALENSKFLYSQAENLLLEELELKDFKVEDDLSYIVDLSEVKKFHRADAEYFQPKYEKILEVLKKQKIVRLEDSFLVIRGRNVEYDPGGKIGVIKTKQITKSEISNAVEDFTTEGIIKEHKLPILKKEDVVFASMGVGSLGKINIFYETGKKFTIDSTLRIFRKKNSVVVLPEVCCVFLSSPIGQELIYKYVVGTTGIISINDNDIKKLPLPCLKNKIQQKIADLVQKSHKSRKKAKELLNQSKQKVEEMIEK